MRPSSAALPFALAMALPHLPACGGDDPPGMEPTDTLTYYRDVEPILHARCVSCHQPGQIAPFSLLTYEDAREVASVMDVVVEARIMPPLPPDPGCRPVDDFRAMPDEERQVLRDWIAQGAPAGDPADSQAPFDPPSNVLGPPTRVYDSGLDYDSAFTGSDEYRCFIVDPALTEATPVVAFNVGSTNPAVVHHAIVFLALPQQAAAVDQLDADDPLPGYECFGGAGYQGAIAVAGFAPGVRPMAFPDGSGITLPPGTRFVVQMHYNFLNGRGANRMSVELWEPDAPLTQSPRGLTLVNFSFFLPAGDPDVEATGLSDIVGPDDTPSQLQAREGQVWDVAAHMHMLGKSVRLDLLRKDGTEECLLDIPRWDFNWQGRYRLKEPVPVHDGDRVRITCRWDNSAENQPVIDGVQQEPRDVRWGERSLDEMCLGGLTLTDFPQ